MGKVYLRDNVVHEKLINHPDYVVVPTLNNLARKEIIKNNEKLRKEIWKAMNEENKDT